jgi:nucleoid DNA-binding protein
MKKSELISKVAEANPGKSTTEVGAIIDSAISVIQNSLKEGGVVHLGDFGSFTLRRLAEKKGNLGKNPVTIPAHTVVHFATNKKFLVEVKDAEVKPHHDRRAIQKAQETA